MDHYTKRILSEVQTTYAIPFLNWPYKSWFKKKRIAIDLGSNVGAFSLIFRNFESIICVEPSKEANRIANKNYSLYLDFYPKTYSAALSQNDNQFLELVRVYVDGVYESKDSTTTNWDEKEIMNSGFKGYKGETEDVVSTITLSSILAPIDRKIDFLKCDIEGAEYDGFLKQDLSKIGFLVMELHYSALGKQRTEELISYLEGFFDYYHPNDRAGFHNWPPSSIIKMINKNNSNFLLRISGKLLSDRVVFQTIKVLNKFQKNEFLA